MCFRLHFKNLRNKKILAQKKLNWKNLSWKFCRNLRITLILYYEKFYSSLVEEPICYLKYTADWLFWCRNIELIQFSASFTLNSFSICRDVENPQFSTRILYVYLIRVDVFDTSTCQPWS